MKLKSSSVLCFVFSLVFSLSLVVSSIEPAWALDSDYAFSLYAAPSGYDPQYYGACSPIPVNQFLFYDGKSGGTAGQLNAAGTISVRSAPFEPVDHDRTLYISLGFSSGGSPSITGTFSNRYGNLSYWTSATQQTLTDGVYVAYAVSQYSHGYYYMFRVTIPANTRQFSFVTPASYRLPGQSDYELTCEGAYIVDTSDPSIISMLDDILQQLNDMNIELDRQTDLLRNCASYLFGVNYNVSCIYDLLHNALASETAELDNKTQQAAETIMQQDNAEQYWNDKNQENFDALGLDNFQFSDGVVSALGTVGGLFEGLWDAMGDMTIIFTFPLILGISLVVIGRVARSGGKGKKDDGDDG